MPSTVYGPTEVLQFWHAGLLNKAETRQMLGLDNPETSGDAPDQAFESARAKQRFMACLHECGVPTRRVSQ